MKTKITFALCICLLLGCCKVAASSESDSEKVWDASAVSGTLPVIFVNTEDGKPIVDKVTQIPASLWVEVPEECDQKEMALGSAVEPVSLVIRGRGNSTWLADKKPYKLKFDSKTALMGMPKHKHFSLLALPHGHSDWSAYNCGLEFARYMNLGWTPSMKPVEFVLNGEYLGLYWVIENIKVGKDRLNIYEQPDLNEDDETIPYGWLIELDNTEDECQVVVKENDDYNMRVTYHVPEELSSKQEKWLTDEFTKICEVVYSDNENIAESWDDYIEPYSLAKYFIVRELNSDLDGFAGSVYMYRDKVDDAKWVFGPMWDCSMTGNALSEPTDWYMNLKPDWRHWYLIEQIFKTKKFQDVFLEVWNDFYPEGINHIYSYMQNFGVSLQKAVAANNARWGVNTPLNPGQMEYLFTHLYQAKSKWIDEHKFFHGDASLPGIGVDVAGEVVSEEWFDLSGRKIAKPASGGIYIYQASMSDGTVQTQKKVVID